METRMLDRYARNEKKSLYDVLSLSRAYWPLSQETSAE